MGNSIHAALDGWANFYLISGGAAAGLTGLQFVVQTLLASRPIVTVAQTDPEAATGAFGSPTVVHFTLALILSAMLCAPWPGYQSLRVALGVFGIAALAYSAIVLRRALSQRIYVPVAEDWIWHTVLPAAAYAGVVTAAVFLDADSAAPLFALAAATLILICVGIHNAWDTVTYLTFRAMQADASAGVPAPEPRHESGKKKRRHR